MKGIGKFTTNSLKSLDWWKVCISSEINFIFKFCYYWKKLQLKETGKTSANPKSLKEYYFVQRGEVIKTLKNYHIRVEGYIRTYFRNVKKTSI